MTKFGYAGYRFPPEIIQQRSGCIIGSQDDLTLNMLLSFAKFEREITGERIRDRVAASKRKGIWVGGTRRDRP